MEEKNKKIFNICMKILKYGVLVTTIQDDVTEVHYLDNDLQVLDRVEYPYGAMGGNGYRYPVQSKHKIYELSTGKGYDKDQCHLLELDKNTRKIVDCKLEDRVNPTDLVVSDQKAYVISNLNQNTYIDCYTLGNFMRETCELSCSIALDLCLWEDQVFAFVADVDSYKMVRVDFESGQCEEVFDLSEYCLGDNEPSFFATYNENIYLPCNSILLELSMKDRQIHEIDLPCDGVFGAYQDNEMLYLAFGDQFTPYGPSGIFGFNLSTGEFTSDVVFDHGILQFIADDKEYVILGLDNTVYHYEHYGLDQCKLLNSVELDIKDESYVSGIFPYEVP